MGLAACKEALAVGNIHPLVLSVYSKPSKSHWNVTTQYSIKNTTVKIEVQQWLHIMLVVMLT